MESFEKRQRERRKREKRQDKEARRKERSALAKQVRAEGSPNPDGASADESATEVDSVPTPRLGADPRVGAEPAR